MRRYLLIIPLFLMLGAAANLAVAWRCLYWQQGPGPIEPPARPGELWSRYAEANELHGRVRVDKSNGGLGCDWITLTAQIAPPPDGEGPAPPFMRITRAGFPMRAFESMNSWGTVEPEYRGGIPVRPFNTNIAWVSVLPYRPIPIGFAVNTLLYAVLLSKLLVGPFAFLRGLRLLREERRRQHGRCPKCGYDLSAGLAIGCPECGWEREEAKS